MACMKLGTKTDAFRREGHTWLCTTELPSDVTIQIGEMSFHLHKFPLITRSGLLAKLIGDCSNEDEHVCIVHLDEIPGGSKSLELIIRFCYDVKIELTPHNVITLRCASECLEMTDEFGENNLITLTETFLTEVFATWADTMKALESCEEVLPDAEDLFLVSRCINSLATKASMGVNNHGILPTSIVWNGITTSNPETDDWWQKDASLLSFHLYKRVIKAISSQGMKPETIAGSLMSYIKKYIPLINRKSSLIFNDANNFKTFSSYESDQRNLFEDIVELLPNEKGIVSTKFLLKLLRTAMILHVNPSCQENLEKRVGAQLDSVVLEDILIPNQGFNTVETLYDIDCFQRIVDYFLSIDYGPNAVCSPCILSEGPECGHSGPRSLASITSVANLVDMFLADVAADVNLKVPKFKSLATSVPDYARPFSDGIYRAIDIYFKGHPWLMDTEREQMCRLMNVQKLSLEASTHASQNERLPLRVIVQVLFFEQLRLRTSLAGWFYVSENLENTRDFGCLRNDDGEVACSQERDGRMEEGEMRERVIELERECETMKYEIRKTVKTKRIWDFFCKRKINVI
ncbi:hypothetical protein L2E82_28353 [Cichorium intybus]|uniref:Uncharacterized protein n=1 Tax=Cichorium intybus TaxID=13427 RepID=A0ACB9CVP7_CICIN|nr:hypothetical protein L2E82_28353 [Cichorium intybus]